MPKTTPANDAIEKLVTETDGLYSLPAVALEVLRLTESDMVDATALRGAIEKDPALSVRLLRVVNSSLFGLSSEVSNLTQALALLGARPLKMLVLGFSLPDRLLAEASGEQLQRFWRASLTRAMVARDLATEHFDFSESSTGDDAFLAGLLQDIGVLVLLGQLGDSYAKLLASAAEQGVDPVSLEQESLGFTRTDLSAALAKSWRLPETLVDAIAGEGFTLARPVKLADLLVKLVVDRQLDALSQLLELGESYCGLSGYAVRAMVAPLEDRVTELAQAMSAPLGDKVDYLKVVTEAQERLARLAQSTQAVPAASEDDQLCESLLAQSRDLSLAMRQFLQGKPDVAARLLRTEGAHKPAANDLSDGLPDDQRSRLVETLEQLSLQTRDDRNPLSLALVHVDADLENRLIDQQLEAALDEAGELLGARQAARLTIGPQLIALLLPAVNRGDSTSYLQDMQERLTTPPDSDEASLLKPITARIGLATVEAVPNRFDVNKLIDAATGCLATARSSGNVRVRSIEVY